MTDSLSNSRELIAREAVEQLAAAVQTILQLEHLMKAVRNSLDGESGATHLIALGIYVANDHSEGFDNMRAHLHKRLNDCAQQSQRSPARGAGGAA